MPISATRTAQHRPPGPGRRRRDHPRHDRRHPRVGRRRFRPGRAASVATPSGSVVVFNCANPAAAVKAAGGTVTSNLPLINGVSATLPKGSQLTGCTVTADQAMHVSGKPGDGHRFRSGRPPPARRSA